MSNEFPREELNNALEMAGVYDHEAAVRESYQGRGYAADGFGIVVENIGTVAIMFAAMSWVAAENYHMDEESEFNDDTLLYSLGNSLRVDSMGLSTIVYFPGWTLV